MRKLEAIVACDENWGIGKDGGLLVHLPGDLKYFKETTMGSTIVMGRKTYESMPGQSGQKSLPGRRNILMTRNEDYVSDCKKFHSVDSLLDYLDGLPKDERVFIIGGERMYRKFLPLVSVCYVTKIDGSYDADVFFPNLDENPDWEMVWESEPQEDKGIGYVFTRYERKR